MSVKPKYLLKNARFVYDTNDDERAEGNVYGHPRFPDGFGVTTSKIVGFDVANEIIETRNSFYEIQNWRRRKEDKDRPFEDIPPLTDKEVREIFGWFQKSFRGARICERA